jgi:glycosyltransferase involved in cell wall biosynthesis
MRSYHTLRYLSQRHKVWLACFVRPNDCEAFVEHVGQFCERIATVPMPRSRSRDGWAFMRSLIGQEPFLITRDESLAMQEALRGLMKNERFDCIHADQLWMAPYALFAQKLARQSGENPRLVLDQHNAVHLIPERMAENTRNAPVRWALEREARLMRRFEVHTCQQFDELVWVTQEDLQAVKHQAQKLGVAGFDAHSRHNVIPICIDPQSVRPIEPLSTSAVIFFLGGMHWPPNAEGVNWFVRETFPLVEARLQGARFMAVGKSPPKQILKISRVSAPGFVGDVEPYWRQGRVFAVPLRAGGGMRVKILDAWAHGMPVVSTTVGAEGLEYIDGENILIADAAQDFAEAVRRAIQEPGLGERLGQNGRRWVEEQYNWRGVYQAWDRVYPA